MTPELAELLDVVAEAAFAAYCCRALRRSVRKASPLEVVEGPPLTPEAVEAELADDPLALEVELASELELVLEVPSEADAASA